MNKQSVYAILTIMLIPIGILLVCAKMVGDTTETQDTTVQIMTDNPAYQQIAKAIAGQKGRVSLMSGNPRTAQQKTKLKKAELLLTDNHSSVLLTAAEKLHSSPKLVIASDYIHTDSPTQKYYLSPNTTVVMAQQIVNYLSDMDPRNRDTYVKNNKQFVEKTSDLTALYTKLKNIKDIRYVATNKSQNLLMTQLGYTVETDNVSKLTDKQMSDLESKLADKKIQFIFTTAQNFTENEQKLVNMAKKNDVPVVTFSQFTPDSTQIWNWQLMQLKKIQKALDK
ncbi:metal ABC transporter solute-binding protein, Zn/Mn family [Leuconostoc mesenteroides]